MLRGLVLTVSCVWFIVSVRLAAVVPGLWPMLVASILFLLGTLFERVNYRGAGGALPLDGAGDWTETGERFWDETSGMLVTVWFNASTGERRYIEAEKAEPDPHRSIAIANNTQ